MKDSDNEPFTTGNRVNGNTVPFCSLNPPQAWCELTPKPAHGTYLSKPLHSCWSPWKLQVGDMRNFGPFGRWYLSWCCYLAQPYHRSKMGCFHQSKGNQEWRTPTMCGSSRRCLWSGHLKYLLVTGTMVPLRNKINLKFISLSQLRGCQWENWFCIISSNDRFFSLLLLF